MEDELPVTQDSQHFWKAPPNSKAHDPRGTSYYIETFVEGVPYAHADTKVHLPHPNILTTCIEEVCGVCGPCELVLN